MKVFFIYVILNIVIIVCILVGNILFCVVLILFVCEMRRIIVVVYNIKILIIVGIFKVVLLNIGCMIGIELNNIINSVVVIKIIIEIWVWNIFFILFSFICFVLIILVFKWCKYLGFFNNFLFIFFERKVFISILINVVGIVIFRILNRVMLNFVSNFSNVMVVVEIGLVVIVCCEVIMVMFKGCLGWILVFVVILVMIGSIE